MNIGSMLIALAALIGASTTQAGNPGTIFSNHFDSGLATATGKISGTISGLTSSGLRLALNNDIEQLSPAASDTVFMFATEITVGSVWTVTISAQPSGPESCTVSNNSGTLPAGGVSDVAVSCTSEPATTIGGTVSGLPAGGSVTLRLNNDPASDLLVSSNSAYTFASPVAVGSSWSVSVTSTSSGHTCQLSNASGTVPSGGVTNADVSCSPSTTTARWGQFNWDQANWQ